MTINCNLLWQKALFFESASYHLTKSILPSLDSVAKILNEYPKSSLRINGHTDSVGSAESNMTLSERRACDASYLIKNSNNYSDVLSLLCVFFNVNIC